MMERKIQDIFSDFYYQTDSDNKKTFDKYFLGSSTKEPITFSHYIEILTDLLSKRTFGKYPMVWYSRISKKNFMHEDIVSNVGKVPANWVDSLWITKDMGTDFTYPNITTKNYEYYTGIVFLLHPWFDRDDVPFKCMTKLASDWYEYSIKELIGYKYPKYIFRYANKHGIYYSDVDLNTTQLANKHIYTNHIFGPKKLLCYEED